MCDGYIHVFIFLVLSEYQVRGLEFNAITPSLLASGADDGEICIWDLANLLNLLIFHLSRFIVIAHSMDMELHSSSLTLSI